MLRAAAAMCFLALGMVAFGEPPARFRFCLPLYLKKAKCDQPDERNGISSGEHFPRQMRDLMRGLLSAVEADAHDARREIVRRYWK